MGAAKSQNLGLPEQTHELIKRSSSLKATASCNSGPTFFLISPVSLHLPHRSGLKGTKSQVLSSSKSGHTCMGADSHTQLMSLMLQVHLKSAGCNARPTYGSMCLTREAPRLHQSHDPDNPTQKAGPCANIYNYELLRDSPRHVQDHGCSSAADLGGR